MYKLNKEKNILKEKIAKGLGMVSDELHKAFGEVYYNEEIVFFDDVYDDYTYECSFILLNETKRHVWTFDFSTERIIKTLVDDLNHLKDKVCPKCSNHIFKSTVPGYDFQCFFCDEDFYNFEGGY